MIYRDFGKTNEKVSVLGFGCMRLPVVGGDPSNIDEEKAIKMVRYSIDQGVNVIDTAYPYHGFGLDQAGASEPFVAKVLRDGYREKVKLATKLPIWMLKTREDMDKYLNEQLKRLETDHIDFYMVHGINRNYWENIKELGFDEFLDDAISDGRIKYAGFSFHHRIELFKEVVDHYDWSFCLIQYNYLDENYQAGKEGLEYAYNKNMGIAVMEPLRGGQLAHNMPQKVQELFDNYEVKRSPAEWALRWVWNHPEVSVVLSGMNTMEELEENLKIAEEANPNSLGDEELNTLKQAKSIFENKLQINCTSCGYCLPCPSGVNIPENFQKYNDYYLFGSPEEKAGYQFSYDALVLENERASQCIECGICEEHCTQDIKIIKELKKVKELYESN
ncbi:NADP-dependent oxidoreductase domain protein [Methanobacterium lacus]|uniref:NADP-dependent oxidoreductase domain protein n=1 Tax=Methanobacterium lacus (strain AL-21) TaxID=877455 RepID=F0T8K8_METLA|nr:aldo/keto reductase [Methanobacterium lacus]ADZ09759.1 NADP-dependent oxidoreductase domain protein [Methanobacterium lacus]